MTNNKPLQSVSSVELMELCRSNNPDAWDEFINRFHRYITVCAFRETRNYKIDTSEFIQEVFLKLFANDRKIIKEFQGTTEDSVFLYLGTIVYNTAKDMIRREVAQKRSAIIVELDRPIDREKKIPLSDILPATPETSPDVMFEERIIPTTLKDLLNSTLSGSNVTRDRIIFHLHVINGLSAREIAELPNVGLNTSNVQIIIARTKEKLKELLSKKGILKFF